MASSDFWRDLAERFRMIPNSWAMMAMLNLNPERNGLRWELAGQRDSLDEFRTLAMRAGKEVANAIATNLLDAWFNMLRERAFGFKAGQPILGIKPDGSGPRHYLTGTIYDLPKESARLCKTLEASALQKEFEEKQRTVAIDIPQPQMGKPATPPSEIKPIKRVKKRDLSRYLDVAKLTDRQYECASRKWEYDLSISQIARELQLTRKTVDQHIEAAQTKMRLAGMYEKMKKGLVKFQPED